MHLENIMQGVQGHKRPHIMTSSLRNVQNTQIYRDKLD